MSQKTYRTPMAVLRAAQRKLGGRINTYDGCPVLTLTERGLSGQVIDNHLSPRQAAARANLDYRPGTR